MAAFRRLVENDAERGTLGGRARRRIAELFNAEAMIARTRAVYDEVLAERRPLGARVAAALWWAAARPVLQRRPEASAVGKIAGTSPVERELLECAAPCRRRRTA